LQPDAGVPWSGSPPPQPTVPAESTAPPPPPTYTSWENSPAADDLRRRQEELERKAEELQRREQEMQRNMQFQSMTLLN
jgi:secretory carrier-associated membrane protein